MLKDCSPFVTESVLRVLVMLGSAAESAQVARASGAGAQLAGTQAVCALVASAQAAAAVQAGASTGVALARAAAVEQAAAAGQQVVAGGLATHKTSLLHGTVAGSQQRLADVAQPAAPSAPVPY